MPIDGIQFSQATRILNAGMIPSDVRRPDREHDGKREDEQPVDDEQGAADDQSGLLCMSLVDAGRICGDSP